LDGVRQVTLLCLLARCACLPAREWQPYQKFKNTKKDGIVVDMLWMWSYEEICKIRPLLLPLQGT
jgi:hypothetical protein